MTDVRDILAIKRAAQERLLALPGVHAVAIGTKIRDGRPTDEPSIVVFTTYKRRPDEVADEERIPSQIEGVPTDVIERPLPDLIAAALPDETQYKILTGGIQIQAGTPLTGQGTLGCIAKTKGTAPLVVGVTCQHVFNIWTPVPNGFAVDADPQNKYRVFLSRTNLPGSRLRCSISLTPTAGGATTRVAPASVVTTAADTAETVAQKMAAAITTAGAGKVSATSNSQNFSAGTGMGAVITVAPASGYTASVRMDLDPLWATVSGATKVVTFDGAKATGLIVAVTVYIVPTPSGPADRRVVVYATVDGDTPHTVATHVAERINALGNPGITAAGPATAAGSEVTIASGPASNATIISANVSAPYKTDSDAELNAAASATGVTFSGSADGDHYGIYVLIHPLQDAPSSGVFFRPAKNATLASIATALAAAITAEAIKGVTASATGAQLNIGGAELVRCQVTSDARVGQPTNDFPSSCSKCCDKRVGMIVNSEYQLDAAIFQLDAGLKYVAEVQGIGPIAGEHPIADTEAATPDTYVVKKRGRTTGVTTGKVNYLHADGQIGSPPRRYTDAIVIDGDQGATFADHGDSGSALLNAANQVVGIVFGGGSGSAAFATPIAAVTAALGIVVETATVANDVRTVPAATTHMTGALDGLAGATAIIPAPPVERLSVNFARLREAEQELTATPTGSELAATLRRHIPETQRLIGRNPRFAGMWRSYGGPEIVQSILRMPYVHSEPLPSTINGRPLRDCLADIRRLLRRYASGELNRDVRRFEALFDQMLGLTYANLLLTLQARTQE